MRTGRDCTQLPPEALDRLDLSALLGLSLMDTSAFVCGADVDLLECSQERVAAGNVDRRMTQLRLKIMAARQVLDEARSGS